MKLKLVEILLCIALSVCAAGVERQVFVGVVTDIGYLPYDSDDKGCTMVFTTQGVFVVYGGVLLKGMDKAYIGIYSDNRLYLCLKAPGVRDRCYPLTKGN